MTEKEKALDLFVKFYETIPDYVIKENEIAFSLAKTCALIASREIIKVTHIDDYDRKNNRSQFDKQYWIGVEKEIINYETNNKTKRG